MSKISDLINKKHNERGKVTEDDLSDIATGVGRIYDTYRFNLSNIYQNQYIFKKQLYHGQRYPNQDMHINSIFSSYVPSSMIDMIIFSYL